MGAARARRRLAGHALAAAGERASGGTATPTRCAAAQRDADYAYRLAVDPPAAKELRLFGLAGWTIDRFIARRTRLHELQYEATRLRERSVLVEPRRRGRAPTCVVFWSLADAAADGRHRPRPRSSSSPRPRSAPSLIAFGGLNWALDGAAAPGGRRAAARAGDGAGRRARDAATAPADGLPAREIRFRDVTFAYPAAARRRCSTASTSRSRPARRWPSSARTAPARPRWPSCCAGSTTRSRAPSRSTASTCATSTSTRGGARVTAVFQDFIRFELPLRDNVAPAGAPDDVVLAALAEAGAAGPGRPRHRRWPRATPGGTDLSGGQWQRVALARALCAVQLGAGVVLLDEPTAQLDVRGEAEIFERILAATRHCTTILISHRFSTVRQADRICVLEHGRVVELGTHDELMAARRPLPHDVRPAGPALRAGEPATTRTRG